MGIIKVNNIRLHANHGCMEEEAKIGGDYVVNVRLTTDMRRSFETDALEDTVDYVAVHDVVYREGMKRSRLIEHVAFRIAEGIKSEIEGVHEVTVELIKIAPPIGGDVESVAVEVTR